MLSFKEVIDAMECFVKFTSHAEDQCINRPIGSYNEVIEDIQAVGEELMSATVGSDINIVNVKDKRTTCVVVGSDEDFNDVIIIKTVINCGYVKKGRVSLVIND